MTDTTAQRASKLVEEAVSIRDERRCLGVKSSLDPLLDKVIESLTKLATTLHGEGND